MCDALELRTLEWSRNGITSDRPPGPGFCINEERSVVLKGQVHLIGDREEHPDRAKVSTTGKSASSSALDWPWDQKITTLAATLKEVGDDLQ